MGIMEALAVNDKYFDLRGLSKFSCLGVTKLRECISQGMPHYRVKGKIIVKRSEFEQWMWRFHQEVKDLDKIAEQAMAGLR